MAYLSAKKSLHLLICSVLLWPNLTWAQAESFSDVPVTHPQYEAVETLKAANILAGYEDGTFKPERVVTRAEMMKLALKGAGVVVEEKPTESTFKDVKAEDWFSPYVAKALELKIVGGYEDGTFRPQQVVNRVEALKMIFKAKQLVLPTEVREVYKDVAVDAWYAPYVQLTYDKDLLTVQGDEFGRDEGMQRKQIAELLYKLKLLGDAKNLNCWPLKMLIPSVLLWLTFIILNFLSFRKLKIKLRLKHWLFNVLLAPLAAFVLALRHFEVGTLWEGNLRSFLRARHSGPLGQLVIRFLRQNYLALLYLVLVLILLQLVLLLLLTSFETCAYRAVWPSL